MPTWDRPAQPCLATRFPYGAPLTVEGLARVAQAEETLAEMGLRGFRVRDHGSVVRIEASPSDIVRLAQPDVAAQVVARLKALGYAYVTVDLEGYRSGSWDKV